MVINALLKYHQLPTSVGNRLDWLLKQKLIISISLDLWHKFADYCYDGACVAIIRLFLAYYSDRYQCLSMAVDLFSKLKANSHQTLSRVCIIRIMKYQLLTLKLPIDSTWSALTLITMLYECVISLLSQLLTSTPVVRQSLCGYKKLQNTSPDTISTSGSLLCLLRCLGWFDHTHRWSHCKVITSMSLTHTRKNGQTTQGLLSIYLSIQSIVVWREYSRTAWYHELFIKLFGVFCFRWINWCACICVL